MYTELLATDIMLKSSDIASDFVGDADILMYIVSPFNGSVRWPFCPVNSVNV